MFLLFNYASVIPTDGDAFSLAAERLKTCDMVCCRDCGYDRRSRLHTLGFRGRFAPQTNEPASARLACAAVGLFRGLGGALDSVNFGNQNVFGKGTSFTPPTLGHVTPQIGSAQGSTGLDLDTRTALAPTVQAGYFQHFAGTPWMWGGKLSYSYLNIGSAKDGLLIPQSGGFTQDGKFIPFVGNYLVQSYRQTLNQQVSFVPFLGRSFDRSYLYLGAGQTVAQTKTIH
jgi:hypothetical protein